MIMLDKEYEKNPFHNGNLFNTNWRWSHPYTCQAKSSKQIKYRQVGMLAASCPDNWTPATYVGIVVHKTTMDRQPFRVGGAYGDQWNWVHPMLCLLN
jgi:hypothetical protein